MKKILLVFGTRPEAIKMAPLVKAFENNISDFETRVCVTAQHREMLDQVLEFFDISPSYDLDLMKPGQDLFSLTANIITEMKGVMTDYNPDYVFVHGDTTTSMAVALAAFYSDAQICHVEAGLRTHNKKSPFPEEMNRQLTGRIADYHFAPTKKSQQNLLDENINPNAIKVTGNTVIDALNYSVDLVKNNPSDLVLDLAKKLSNNDVILVTGHRRENHGQGFEQICNALKQLAEKNTTCKIVYPVHLNPKVQEPVQRILGQTSNIILINPLSYPDFIWMMNRSKIIITDSGGVQEEAPSLGKPVLVMRDTTERPEAVEAGTVKLVGTDTNKIVVETQQLLQNSKRYFEMSEKHNPYGDGKACDRIVGFIKDLKSEKVSISN